jgi:hypothetical protein
MAPAVIDFGLLLEPFNLAKKYILLKTF